MTADTFGQIEATPTEAMPLAARPADKGRGRDADTPTDIPARGLKDVFWRVFQSIEGDRVLLVAAGVTYYVLLALFPAMTAMVSLYGFVADPTSLADRISFLSMIMPPNALDLFLEQLRSLTQQGRTTLNIGLFGGLALALWSANAGMKAMFEAMNVAYGEKEKRNIFKLNLISLVFTLGAILVAIVVLTGMGLVPAVLSFLWLDRWAEMIIRFLRWPIMLAFVTAGIAVLYRFGPSREPARVQWLTWGAIFSSLAWLAASIGVSFYLSHIANYNATYGALGALIGFMVWTWISSIIIVVGAEINAELEHQTTRDSTTGPEQPMGERGAYMADTVGDAS
ncbi:YihY/virulence factor BrkB family protein [Neorhizobium sp. NPDC001467]|uniref:YihY/virulence factor BrkB family protein n=1 Tax=Neorhizobium sp. NPDC001467 TaxID=3390595 RepID=UPI003CFF49CD